MDLWFLAPSIIAGFTGSWLGFREGRRYGRNEGYVQALNDQRERKFVRTQKQKEEYTAYMRQREERKNGS